MSKSRITRKKKASTGGIAADCNNGCDGIVKSGLESLTELQKPTEAELAIARAIQERKLRMESRSFELTPVEGRPNTFNANQDASPDMQDAFYGYLSSVIRSNDLRVISHICNQFMNVFRDQSLQDSANAGIALLEALAPQDVLETMLATQMIGSHNAACEMIRRSLAPGQSSERVDASVNNATKLMRTFTAQIEALNRCRGKGSQQRVVVEHVNVNEGGQAIVGIVEKGEGTGDGR